MLQIKVLIVELRAVDTNTASTVALDEVAALLLISVDAYKVRQVRRTYLAHEPRDYTMESRASIAALLEFASTHPSEVFRRRRNNVLE